MRPHQPARTGPAVWSRFLPLLLGVSAVPRRWPSFRPSVAVAAVRQRQHLPASVRSTQRQMFAIPPMSCCFPLHWKTTTQRKLAVRWSWPRW
uniref:Putative secreted protein n=1 Tax=Anopheles triannulatus TaxID=58253 RepID=A0A2M4B4T2_9DIPT